MIASKNLRSQKARRLPTVVMSPLSTTAATGSGLGVRAHRHSCRRRELRLSEVGHSRRHCLRSVSQQAPPAASDVLVARSPHAKGPHELMVAVRLGGRSPGISQPQAASVHHCRRLRHSDDDACSHGGPGWRSEVKRTPHRPWYCGSHRALGGLGWQAQAVRKGDGGAHTLSNKQGNRNDRLSGAQASRHRITL